MSAAYYTVRRHILPVPRVGSHSCGRDGTLLLAVKQYTTKAQHNCNGITVIAAHANACSKEVYEPLWDRVHEAATRNGIAISNIWMADVAHQGDSGMLNEDTCYDKDVSLTDHSRDLFTLITHFKEHMQQPIFGLGHSMGGTQIVHLSLMYPRLFMGIILIDPMVQETQSVERTLAVVKATLGRRDRWSSREQAKQYLRKGKVYRAWDENALDKYIEHCLRRTTHGDMRMQSDEGVTLSTPVHQEVLAMVRPGFTNATGFPDATLLRPEPRVAFDMLKHVRPSVLYLTGRESNLSEDTAEKMARTGVGVGGSGGKATHIILEDVGHYAPMESPQKTAEAIVQWLGNGSKDSSKSWKL